MHLELFEDIADRIIMTKIRTYSELSKLNTFSDRFEYLKLDGSVGVETFGFDRYLNQIFYKSDIWRRTRREVSIRDRGCDLGLDGYEIHGRYIIHHMNPISVDDIYNQSDYLLDPEYLITTVLPTHNAIHYGDISLLPQLPKERSPNDTCPWLLERRR